MKHFLSRALCCLTALTLIFGCTSSYESQGNKAYKAAQNTSEDGVYKRDQEKLAYQSYNKAVREAKGAISDQLRSRYLEMCLVRVNRYITSGSASMDAIDYILEDVDTYWAPNVPEAVTGKYVDIMFLLADSTIANGKVLSGFEFVDKAVEKAVDKEGVKKRRDELKARVIEDQYAMAELNYQNGRVNKDNEDLLRAEYYTKVTLVLDSTHEKAHKLLSMLRKQNRDTYSVYSTVVENYTDTLLFDKINKYRVLLAVPAESRRGRLVYLQVNMYNYSNNPQRLKARNFSIVDSRGKSYTAYKSSKIQPDILDQEVETNLRLVFKNPMRSIKKLVFESDDKQYRSEKYFY